MRMKWALAPTALLLAACSKPVQLPVHQFDVPVPEVWQGGESEASTPPTEWWTDYDDSGLDSTIRKALECSQNLEAASARVEIATLDSHIAGTRKWPELSIGANRIRQRQNFVGLPFPGLADRVLSNTFSNAGLSFNIAWEADLWNRLSSEKLAADATVSAREADQAAARLSLSGQVAKAWFAAVEAQEQIKLAQAVVEHLEIVLERTRERYRFGSRPSVEVRVAEGDIERARATVRERERARDMFVRQVEVLACEYPAGEMPLTEGLPAMPPQVPAGLPSDLVGRRPDLLSAERELLGADARIVQARAALKPSFSLTTVAGTSSNTLLDMVNPGLQIWNYGLGFAQPLFNRGRLKSNVRITEAQAEEAAARYEGLLWTAYLEVESALAAEKTLREQESDLRASQRSTRDAIGLAEQRYRAGMGDVFSILALQRSVLETEIAVLGLRRVAIDNRVDLHLALGGGFAPGAVQGDQIATR